MTFDSITRGPLESNLPENIDADRNGSLVGGAHVPGQGCFCNCGLRASLNFDTISISYDDGTDTYSESLTPTDYWAWVDASRPPLGASEYIAYLDFTDAASGCDSRIIAIAAYPPTTADIGIGLAGLGSDFTGRNVILEVTTAGQGASGIIAFDGGSGDWGQFDFYARDGIKPGLAIGSYVGNNGSMTISEQRIGEWRDRPGNAP